MRFLLILEQKVKTPRNVNTVFMVAVICPVCPFIAQKGSLRKRNKFDVLTERMISLCRCLWKIRFFSVLLLMILLTVKWMLCLLWLVVAHFILDMDGALWRQGTQGREMCRLSHKFLCFSFVFLVGGRASTVEKKNNVPVRASCTGNILCSTCGLQPNQLYSPFARLP